METRDITSLTAALRTVGARLDTYVQGFPVSDGPDARASACPVPCAQAERCFGAMREAVRALELLLSEAPR